MSRWAGPKCRARCQRCFNYMVIVLGIVGGVLGTTDAAREMLQHYHHESHVLEHHQAKPSASNSIDTSCRLAYSSGIWAPSATQVVPGVPYGWSDTQHGDLYFNDKGYNHCRNGQGGTSGLKLQTPSELKHVYTSGNSTCPYRIFSSEEARECLRGKWIHMNGDSLVRDQFYGRPASRRVVVLLFLGCMALLAGRYRVC